MSGAETCAAGLGVRLSLELVDVRPRGITRYPREARFRGTTEIDTTTTDVIDIDLLAVTITEG